MNIEVRTGNSGKLTLPALEVLTDYISVTKTGIVSSNLMTVLAGMWLAAEGMNGFLGLSVLKILFTLLGSACILASATSLNNYYDRDIDGKMERTRRRATVQGRVNPRYVLWMGTTLAVLGSAMLLAVHVKTAVVALVGFFVYVFVYTMWLKRTHYLNTIVGSIAGAVPPLIGWSAVAGTLDAGAWALFAVMFLWQPPHFFALAIKRSDEYRNAGIPMLPVVKGFAAARRQIVFFVGALIPASLLLFFYIDSLGMSYAWLALLLGIGWLALAVWGFFVDGEKRKVWTRFNFVYSLVYLMGLLIGMLLIAM